MLATITLDRREVFEMKRTVTGDTILTIPLDVLKRAYCEYVAAQVSLSASQRHEGVPIQ